jgi:signal transduction histidine kinase
LRLLKENTVKYQSFTNSVQYFTKSPGTTGDLKLISFETHNNRINQFEKYNFFVQNLLSFNKIVSDSQNIVELHIQLSGFIRKIVVAREVDLFLYDESQKNLIAINPEVSVAQNSLVNKAQKDGVLDWLFETKKPTLIPELTSYSGNGVKLTQTLFPIFYNNARVGVLSLLGPANKISEDSIENKSIQILNGIVIPKIISIKQKAEINKLLGEVQLYQSKIKNELKLYATGEYAEGILQNILNSLQMIISSVDFLASESKDLDTEIIDKVKERILHIRELSQRLTKFDEVNNQTDNHIVPCELNTVINETYEIVKSTLSNLQIECELDLETDLPSVVSNQKHLKQVATNIFSLIKRKAKKGSGLLIQTRSVNDVTILSFFLTDYWPEINSNSDPMVNLTVRIVKEVMKKNEGVADFESLPMKGTTIHLLFPLKRK